MEDDELLEKEDQNEEKQSNRTSAAIFLGVVELAIVLNM